MMGISSTDMPNLSCTRVRKEKSSQHQAYTPMCLTVSVELHINLWDVFFDPELCMWLSDLKTFSVRILRMLIQAMLVVSVKSENVRHSAGHLC